MKSRLCNSRCGNLNNSKRGLVLEKRISRLEKMMTEDADNPTAILMDAVDDGIVSWEVLCRELMANLADDALWTTCSNLGLIEDEEFESRKRVSRKPAKNESSMTVPRGLRGKKIPLIRQGNNNYFEVPDMLDDKGLPYVYNADWLAEKILDNGWAWFEHTFVLVNPDKDMKYLEMSVDYADEGRADSEDLDDEDEEFESRKRPVRKAKNESAKQPAKRSLVSHYRK